MSFVIVEPDLLSSTAVDVAGIGSAISAANGAAAAPTTGMLALGADEISAAITGFLNGQAREYQTISAQLVTLVNERLVRAFSAGAQWYAGAESAITTSLQNAERQVQGIASLLANGGRPVPNNPTTSTPSEPTTPTTPTTP